MERSQKIIRTSIIGIVVNVILVLFKMAVGFFSNSIAIILDAVNNLGDALSSIITIIGTKLSGRAPNKKHPYGYGRIEYLTSVLIAVIVLMAGLTSLRESPKAEGQTRIYTHGEKEALAYGDRLANGIDVNINTVGEFKTMFDYLGMDSVSYIGNIDVSGTKQSLYK